MARVAKGATATKTRKTNAKKGGKKARTVKKVPRKRPLLDADEFKAAEAEYVAKGYRIVKGTLCNRGQDPKKEKRFENKRSVEVECATRGCGTIFRIATSDLHQKKFCDACTLESRSERKNASRRKGKKRTPK